MRNKKSTKLIIKRNNWKLGLHKDFLARNCFPKMSNLCFCNKKYGKFLQGKNLSLGSFLWLGGLVYIWINYVVVNLRIMAKKTKKTNWHKRNKSVWQRCKESPYFLSLRTKLTLIKNKDWLCGDCLTLMK